MNPVHAEAAKSIKNAVVNKAFFVFIEVTIEVLVFLRVFLVSHPFLDSSIFGGSDCCKIIRSVR